MYKAAIGAAAANSHFVRTADLYANRSSNTDPVMFKTERFLHLKTDSNPAFEISNGVVRFGIAEKSTKSFAKVLIQAQ